MKLEDQTILFFPRTMGLGGTENVVLQLCEIFQPRVKKIIVCSCGGEHVERLENMGITHYIIPDVERKSPKVMIQTLRRLSFILKKEQITVVHTHHRMAAFYTRVLNLFKDFVFLNTSHNTFQDKKFLTKWIYQGARLITCGEMVKRNLVEVYHLKEEKITVIHNAVKPFLGPVVEIKELSEWKKQGYVLVGNIGRLSKQKGMCYFIEAASLLKQDGLAAKYVIVGDGEEKDTLHSFVKRLNLENDVAFLGYRSDVQNVMAQLDLIVLSSLWEGLPLTPIEAFSVGKTVVATAVDGTPEVVQHENNGMLTESKNSKEIAQAVLKILQDENLKQYLEKNAKKCFAQEFSFNVFVNAYVQQYEVI